MQYETYRAVRLYNPLAPSAFCYFGDYEILVFA